MKPRFTFYLIVGLLVFTAFNNLFSNHYQAVVKGNNDFCFDLYQKLREREGNLFFSPYSISTALAMTYAGARGQTEKEMEEVLHFILEKEQLFHDFSEIQSKLNALQKQGYIQLKIANSLWFQKGYDLSDEFININRDYFSSELKFVDFVNHHKKASTVINSWVAEKTEKKIKNIINPGALSSLTRMVLCNAIYFKAPWANQFLMTATEKAPFYLTSQDSIYVDMMNQTEEFFYKDFGTFAGLELPYTSSGTSYSFGGDKDPSMIIFLPKDKDGLSQFENNLTSSHITRWIQELRTTEVIVKIPKFKTTCEFQLATILSEMGMPSAFNPETANFLGMTGKKELFINHLIHKAYVDVNEQGTEAAASTAVIVELGIEPNQPKPKEFIADHPFVFLIYDNQTGSILFMGRIVDPTKNK